MTVYFPRNWSSYPALNWVRARNLRLTVMVHYRGKVKRYIAR